ncbi:putative porin [Mangrovimonas sp. DI 80]|uniref:putative porin n=1 Tax=Mangrovimonas sp. DI 80 TaxID=1779330 RepID=UPI0009771C0B|nr:putative porin [Mangrovimonas sp. DI 80]OMP31602.1 hypothetical protein BKM32_07760 [Mangrovimonas sp. DI 80]
MRKLLFSVFVLVTTLMSAQVKKFEKPLANEGRTSIDTTKANINGDKKSKSKDKSATIDMYKMVSYKNDTTFVDTSLTIKKDYKFNYLRKDNFERINFLNTGQTFNSLSYNVSNTDVMPVFGARARHFNYMEIEDIYYYEVATPFTELCYKTVFEQGHLLDALFSVNTSKRLNFTIAYKGLRSLGKYQHQLTSTGNFRFVTNFSTKNNRYKIRGHIVMQDLMNEENGGLRDIDLVNFESGNKEFKDRSVFDPVFENAENILEGKRFHLVHQYQVTKAHDSLQKPNFYVGHVISFEDKYYQFVQSSRNDFFGEAFLTSKINDKVTLEDFRNRFYVDFKEKTIGNIKVNLDYYNYNYGYDALVILEGNAITNRLKGDVLEAGGSYANSFGKFNVLGEFGINVSGDLDGNFFKGSANYSFTDDIKFSASFNSSSKAPNYNYLLYHSDYLNYNWDNSSTFDNVQTQQLAVELQSEKLANLSFDYSNITNYTYFAKDELAEGVKPFQTDNTVNYLRLKLNREIRFGKFALDNTFMYQNVLNGDNIFNVPQFITRNTFYYSNHFFKKKALFLQAGITFKYFTEYNMNGYDPLLAEFYVQNDTKIGNFPMLDFFVNAKVRTMRIYLKAEHFNSAWTGYKFYSAPNYPYRDFIVRFGLVWNFFL